ncbi:hypothetical protein FJ986_21215 [Mesorhizobium sp. B1-1-1]|nr:hypothetical protein FJ986_21215 [Mesorhizobium sp. B1-1-1]
MEGNRAVGLCEVPGVTALLPYCPTALLPYCPTALLPYCPTALIFGVTSGKTLPYKALLA